MTQSHHTPDATQFLMDDHKRLTGLFSQFAATWLRAPEMFQGVADEIFMELEIHSQVEEEIFYPAVRSIADTALLVLLEESREAHEDVAKRIAKLKSEDPHAEFYKAHFSALITAVELHVKDEEQTVFPFAKRKLSDQLHDLGAMLQARRYELLSNPRYRQSLPAAVQNPNGGEQKRNDISTAA